MRTLPESLILTHLHMSDVIRAEFHDMHDDIIRLRIEPSSHLRIVYLLHSALYVYTLVRHVALLYAAVR